MKTTFCEDCRKEVEYDIQMEKCKITICGKTYEMNLPNAVCKNCGSKVDAENIVDRRIDEIDRQYRESENIILLCEIEKLVSLCGNDAAFLASELGIEEKVFTNYLAGQVPSKENSDILRNVLAQKERQDSFSQRKATSGQDNSILIEKVERSCPLCNRTHLVEKRKRRGSALVKGETVEFDEVYFHCPDSMDKEYDEFVSAGMMDENFQNAKNEYKK